MFRPIFTIVLSLFLGNVLAAEQLPSGLKDAHKKPVSITRILHIPKLELVRYSQACSFRFRDPYFGYLEDGAYFSKKFPMTVMCYPANNGRTTGKPVRYNEKTKQWERDINNRFESWYDEEDRKALDHAIQFYALGTANAQGYAYTEDDIIGDERYRLRRLRYCLFKDAKALCGDGDMGYLQDGKKRDLTPYALQILRSIEFIDDTPAPESVPASVQDTTTATP